MEPLKILVVEDETITAMDIRETLEEAGHNVTDTVRNLPDALKSVTINPPDLALIDIKLNDSPDNGVAIATQIQATRAIPVIYLTASKDAETIRQAKPTLPIAYLTKPFRHEELNFQIELAYHYYQSTQSNGSDSSGFGYLYLPIGKGHVKINPENVLCILAARVYVNIVTVDSKTLVVSMNLSNLAQYFPVTNFFRLSRSVLINLNYIERLETDQLYLESYQKPLPIPEANRKELLKRLKVIRTRK